MGGGKPKYCLRNTPHNIFETSTSTWVQRKLTNYLVLVTAHKTTWYQYKPTKLLGHKGHKTTLNLHIVPQKWIKAKILRRLGLEGGIGCLLFAIRDMPCPVIECYSRQKKPQKRNNKRQLTSTERADTRYSTIRRNLKTIASISLQGSVPINTMQHSSFTDSSLIGAYPSRRFKRTSFAGIHGQNKICSTLTLQLQCLLITMRKPFSRPRARTLPRSFETAAKNTADWVGPSRGHQADTTQRRPENQTPAAHITKLNPAKSSKPQLYHTDLQKSVISGYCTSHDVLTEILFHDFVYN